MPLHRVNLDGHARFLTFSCFGNQKFLKSDRACQWLADSLLEAKLKLPFSLWAYVFMPDHVHLLILPKQGVDVPKLLARMKLATTRRCINWLEKHNPSGLESMLDKQPNGKESHRFWQRGGGYDRNLFSSKEVHEKVNYIHQNPVKAGLVRRANEWRWSSAAAWENGKEGALPIDRGDLPALIT